VRGNAGEAEDAVESVKATLGEFESAMGELDERRCGAAVGALEDALQAVASAINEVESTITDSATAVN